MTTHSCISIVLDLKILSLYLNYLEFLMNLLISWRSAIGYSNVTFSINQSCLTITCLSRLHNKCVDTPVESPSCWWDKLKLDKIEHFLPSQHFFFISQCFMCLVHICLFKWCICLQLVMIKCIICSNKKSVLSSM